MNPLGSGVIEGGWEFVRAAYAVSVVILTVYVASVVSRYRAEQARRRRDEGRGRP